MATESPQEFWTGERCWITELVNHDNYPEVSLARTRVEPGVMTELHSLSVREWYLIESGRGQMYIGKEPARLVTAGDVVAIPKGVAQKIHNDNDLDLVFLCICVPRFSQKCYTSLE